MNRPRLFALVAAGTLGLALAAAAPSLAAPAPPPGPSAPPAPSGASAQPAPAAAPAVTTPGASPLGDYRLVSYVPEGSEAGTAGLSTDLWADYSAASVASDLSLIEGMGANAVRVFISTGDTGPSYPQVTPTFSSDLAAFVRSAAADHLKVVLSIFNEYPYVPAVSGGWSNTSSASQWMASVVDPYRSDPEIAYIEMRNEVPAPGEDAPNPAGSGVLAAAWLNTMMPVLRTDAGSDPLVLSQNNGVAGYEALDAALIPAAKPDAYSYHYYDAPGYLYGQLTTLETELSRPVFVGETGYSTSLTNTEGGAANLTADTTVRNAYQAWYLQAVASVTSSLGMGVPGVWDLWVTPSESSPYETDFGLYTETASGPVAQPAVATVSSIFAAEAAGAPVNPPSIDGTFAQAGSGDGSDVPSPWQSYYIAGQVESGSAQGGDSLCITSAKSDSYFYEILPLAGVSGTHTLTVWSLGGNSNTSVAIRWLSLAGTPIGPDSRVVQPKAEGAWTPLTISGLAPAGASTAELILQGNSADCFSDVAFN